MTSQTLNSFQQDEGLVHSNMDVYFSADVETDGPIPGPFSLLSFALVYAGRFDGLAFKRADPRNRPHFYAEMRPISTDFQDDALRVNGLDRARLLLDGKEPSTAMTDASRWIQAVAGGARPVLVAYPLSFDWSWLYWYFVKFSETGSPFSHSQCFDLKTAFATKAHMPISQSGRSRLPIYLRPEVKHTHNALDDAIEQAEIFANVFEWSGKDVR